MALRMERRVGVWGVFSVIDEEEVFCT